MQDDHDGELSGHLGANAHDLDVDEDDDLGTGHALDPVAEPLELGHLGDRAPIAGAENEAGDPGPAAHIGVVGDPEGSLAYAEVQSRDGLCAVTSVGMVASRILGQRIPGPELEDLARGLGLLDSTDQGLTASETATLLDHVGVSATVEEGDAEALRTFLAEGRGIILAIDADELVRLDDQVDGGSGTNHALVLTGIDDERDVAYVDDPGRIDGAGLEVPIERLLDAWQDSGNTMIVTRDHGSASGPAPGPVHLIEVEGSQGSQGTSAAAVAGYVMLPLSAGFAALGVRARRRDV